MRTVELFAGAGGLALGASEAGFRHDAVLEWNHDACETIRVNQRRGLRPVVNWKLHEADIREFDFQIYSGIDLIAGGPPCQPFSIGGKHRGPNDTRNLFSEIIRAVRVTQPKAILVENVRGLLRPAFSDFFQYVLSQLKLPTVARRDDESWQSHFLRLQRALKNNYTTSLRYSVSHAVVNAADFGVPQRRNRIFLVGFRSDLEVDWEFPKTTHSQDALLYSQYISGEYWDRHEIPTKLRPEINNRIRSRIDKLSESLFPPESAPWVTVRDAIAGLPNPSADFSVEVQNHVLNPGARAYAGHTGSPLDEPAKALKAGDHGVPGGENMIAYPSGEVRYFTVRESARLQTFPDDYVFYGSWTESMRQLGNAVPVKLAKAIAKKVYSSIS